MVRIGENTFGHVTPVTAHDLWVLDAIEDVPASYRRELCPVRLFDGSQVDAWVYLSNSGTFRAPSEDYLRAVAKTLRAGRVTMSWRKIPVR